jgi:hypothetical protein
MQFLSGLRHCHVRDLNSYVLRERLDAERGMVRIFHNRGHSLATLMDGDRFRLAPHNHRQDIALFPLFGSVANVSFNVERDSFDPPPSGWRRPPRYVALDSAGVYFIYPNRAHEYHFGSALASGLFDLSWKRTVELTVSQVASLPGNGLEISSSEVHTVVAEPGSAWLVIEGGQQTDDTLCYSRKYDFRLSADGLYEEMNGPQLMAAASSFDHLDGIVAKAMRELAVPV